MSTYSKIYIVLALIIAFYTICHKLDLLSIASTCYIVYSIYCIKGIGISGYYRPNLSPLLYYAVYSQLAIIFIIIIISRKRKKESIAKKLAQTQKIYPNRVTRLTFRIYTLIIAIFAFANIFSAGLSVFSTGKAMVWEKTNVFYVISLYGAYPSFAYGIRNDDKLIWFTSLLIELSIFFAGARAFFTTIIVIFLCEKGRSLWINRKKNTRIFILGACGVVFLLVYRMIDEQIMAGDISGAFETLKNPSTWATALEFNEPRVIIANYDYVLTSEVRFPINDVIYRIIDFVPGMTKIINLKLTFPEYFSNWLMDQVHGSKGVGGTIWGESMAMFGFPGIMIATIVWMIFVNMCNNHLDYKKNYSYFLVSLGTYLAWYINRLDYNRVAQAFKVMLFCFLIWVFIFFSLGGKLKKTNMRRKICEL